MSKAKLHLWSNSSEDNRSAREPWLRLQSTLARLAPASGSSVEFPASWIRQCAPVENHYSTLGAGEILDFYLNLARESLGVAFVLTQRHAAIRRILTSSNQSFIQTHLPAIQDGSALATVGISHLTTSRRHTQPAVIAREARGGWILDGECPWVTASHHADWFVIGAALESDPAMELLFVVHRNLPGIQPQKPFDMLALTESCTGSVALRNVAVTDKDLLHGPIPNVVEASSASHVGTGTGGYQTSALALGHAARSILFLEQESTRRPELREVIAEWIDRWNTLRSDLLQLASGLSTKSASGIRKLANDIAIQSAQSALTAAKGAGFLTTHPVSQWCRESLFFLVWSCPQSVAMAHQNCLANPQPSVDP